MGSKQHTTTHGLFVLFFNDEVRDKTHNLRMWGDAPVAVVVSFPCKLFFPVYNGQGSGRQVAVSNSKTRDMATNHLTTAP